MTTPTPDLDENLQDLLAQDAPAEEQSAGNDSAQDAPSAPARASGRRPAPSAAAAEEEEEERSSGKARSAAPKLSWSQASAITRFAIAFTTAPEEQREFAASVFDLEIAGGDPVEAALDLAQRLMPAGGAIAAWRLYSSLATKIADGGPNALGWAEGAALVTALAEGGAALTRDFVRLVNLSETTLRPSRRAPAIEVLQGAVAALSGPGAGADASALRFVDDLIAIWPGER